MLKQFYLALVIFLFTLIGVTGCSGIPADYHTVLRFVEEPATHDNVLSSESNFDAAWASTGAGSLEDLNDRLIGNSQRYWFLMQHDDLDGVDTRNEEAHIEVIYDGTTLDLGWVAMNRIGNTGKYNILGQLPPVVTSAARADVKFHVLDARGDYYAGVPWPSWNSDKLSDQGFDNTNADAYSWSFAITAPPALDFTQQFHFTSRTSLTTPSNEAQWQAIYDDGVLPDQAAEFRNYFLFTMEMPVYPATGANSSADHIYADIELKIDGVSQHRQNISFNRVSGTVDKWFAWSSLYWPSTDHNDPANYPWPLKQTGLSNMIVHELDFQFYDDNPYTDRDMSALYPAEIPVTSNEFCVGNCLPDTTLTPITSADVRILETNNWADTTLTTKVDGSTNNKYYIHVQDILPNDTTLTNGLAQISISWGETVPSVSSWTWNPVGTDSTVTVSGNDIIIEQIVGFNLNSNKIAFFKLLDLTFDAETPTSAKTSFTLSTDASVSNITSDTFAIQPKSLTTTIASGLYLSSASGITIHTDSTNYDASYTSSNFTLLNSDGSATATTFSVTSGSFSGGNASLNLTVNAIGNYKLVYTDSTWAATDGAGNDVVSTSAAFSVTEFDIADIIHIRAHDSLVPPTLPSSGDGNGWWQYYFDNNVLTNQPDHYANYYIFTIQEPSYPAAGANSSADIIYADVELTISEVSQYRSWLQLYRVPGTADKWYTTNSLYRQSIPAYQTGHAKFIVHDLSFRFFDASPYTDFDISTTNPSSVPYDSDTFCVGSCAPVIPPEPPVAGAAVVNFSEDILNKWTNFDLTTQVTQSTPTYFVTVTDTALVGESLDSGTITISTKINGVVNASYDQTLTLTEIDSATGKWKASFTLPVGLQDLASEDIKIIATQTVFNVTKPADVHEGVNFSNSTIYYPTWPYLLDSDAHIEVAPSAYTRTTYYCSTGASGNDPHTYNPHSHLHDNRFCQVPWTSYNLTITTDVTASSPSDSFSIKPSTATIAIDSFMEVNQTSTLSVDLKDPDTTVSSNYDASYDDTFFTLKNSDGSATTTTFSITTDSFTTGHADVTYSIHGMGIYTLTYTDSTWTAVDSATGDCIVGNATATGCNIQSAVSADITVDSNLSSLTDLVHFSENSSSDFDTLWSDDTLQNKLINDAKTYSILMNFPQIKGLNLPWLSNASYTILDEDNITLSGPISGLTLEQNDTSAHFMTTFSKTWATQAKGVHFRLDNATFTIDGNARTLLDIGYEPNLNLSTLFNIADLNIVDSTQIVRFTENQVGTFDEKWNDDNLTNKFLEANTTYEILLKYPNVYDYDISNVIAEVEVRDNSGLLTTKNITLTYPDANRSRLSATFNINTYFTTEHTDMKFHLVDVSFTFDPSGNNSPQTLIGNGFDNTITEASSNTFDIIDVTPTSADLVRFIDDGSEDYTSAFLKTSPNLPTLSSVEISGVTNFKMLISYPELQNFTISQITASVEIFEDNTTTVRTNSVTLTADTATHYSVAFPIPNVIIAEHSDVRFQLKDLTVEIDMGSYTQSFNITDVNYDTNEDNTYSSNFDILNIAHAINNLTTFVHFSDPEPSGFSNKFSDQLNDRTQDENLTNYAVLINYPAVEDYNVSAMQATIDIVAKTASVVDLSGQTTVGLNYYDSAASTSQFWGTFSVPSYFADTHDEVQFTLNSGSFTIEILGTTTVGETFLQHGFDNTADEANSSVFEITAASNYAISGDFFRASTNTGGFDAAWADSTLTTTTATDTRTYTLLIQYPSIENETFNPLLDSITADVDIIFDGTPFSTTQIFVPDGNTSKLVATMVFPVDPADFDRANVYQSVEFKLNDANFVLNDGADTFSLVADYGFTAISSDNFAIRPHHFDFVDTAPLPQPTLQVDVARNYTVSAFNSDGAVTDNYVATLNGATDMTDFINANCIGADIVPTTGDFTFAAGVTNMSLILTDNVAIDYNITLADSTWCDESIEGNLTIGTVSPNQLFVTPSISNTQLVYLDNNASPQHFDVNLTIQAQDAGNAAMTNYQPTCAAQNIDVNLSYANLHANPHTRARYTYQWTNNLGIYGAWQATGDAAVNSNIIQADNLIDMPVFANTMFNNNGVAGVRVRLNFNRQKNSATNPFSVEINDVNVSDGNIVDTTLNQAHAAATFVYATTKVSNIRHNEQNITSQIKYVLYCDKNCNTALLPAGAVRHDKSLWWYENTTHDLITQGFTSITGLLLPANVSQIGTAPSTTNFNLDIQYNGDRGYPYKTSVITQPSTFLIYNKFNTTLNTNNQNSFDVKFTRDNGATWSGTQDSDTSTKSNASSSSSKRLQW